ncbi:MAG: hypothetical protein ACTH31_09560 [Pseudoclavibacter sp.]
MSQTRGFVSTQPDGADGPGARSSADSAANDLDAAVARSRAIGRDGEFDDTIALDDVRASFADEPIVGSVEPADDDFVSAVHAPSDDAQFARPVEATPASDAAAVDVASAGEASEAAGNGPDAMVAEPSNGTDAGAGTVGAGPVGAETVGAGTVRADGVEAAALDAETADATETPDPEAHTADAGSADAAAADATLADATPAGATPADATPVDATTADATPDAASPAEASADDAAPMDHAATTEDAATTEAPTTATPDEATDADSDAEPEAHPRASGTIEVDRTTGTDDATTFAPLGLSLDTPTAEPDDAPVAPAKRSNRVFAFVVSLLGALVYGALFLAAFAGLRAIYTDNTDIVASMLEFAPTAAFYAPVALVGILFIVWALISNRAGHWSYAGASLVAAALGYLGYHLGVALQLTLNTGGLTLVDPFATIFDQAHLPAGLVAALAATIVVTWFGALIASRGRRLYAKNRLARRRYEQELRAHRDPAAETTDAKPANDGDTAGALAASRETSR